MRDGGPIATEQCAGPAQTQPENNMGQVHRHVPRMRNLRVKSSRGMQRARQYAENGCNRLLQKAANLRKMYML